MNVIRSIGRDLVEKKLWPVAVVLVLALVAIPVAVRGTKAEAPLAPVDNGVAQKAPPVSLDTTVSDTPKVRAGGVRDPFRQLHVPKVKKESTTSAAPSVATPVVGATGTASTGVTPSKLDTPGDGSPVTPSTTTNNASPQTRYFSYRVSLHFGRSGKVKRYGDVKRLTALPSSTFPFFTYLGVLEDQNTAVFLVTADVSASGDGTCRPSKTACQVLALKPGDSVRLVYHPSDGRDPIAYRLEMGSVKRVETVDKAKAAKARASVNRRGNAAFKAMRKAHLVPQIHRYVYSQATGLLKRAKGKRAAKAAAAHAPARVSVETPWGWIAKLNGGVFFAPKKSAKG
jgi:hypothetical protein